MAPWEHPLGALYKHNATLLDLKMSKIIPGLSFINTLGLSRVLSYR